MRISTTLKSGFWSDGTVEVLTKEEQRKVRGGAISCTYIVSYSNGTYDKYSGTCASSNKDECERYADGQAATYQKQAGGSSSNGTCYYT